MKVNFHEDHVLRKVYLVILSILSIVLFSSHSFADMTVKDQKENIIFFVDSKNSSEISQLKTEFGSNNFEYIPEIHLAHIKINIKDKKKLNKYKLKFSKSPDIDTESISPSLQLVSPFILFPNLNYDKFTWSYKRISEGLNGHVSNYGEGVKIAIIDSGIDLAHPGLQDNTITQANYSESPNENDEYGHGTQIAGVIDTLAPKSSIYSYKVMNDKEGDSYNIIKSIIDATNKKVDIINVSLTTQKNPNSSEILNIDAFKAAVEYAKNKGIFVVGSAGNESDNLDNESDNVYLPGGLKDVITVGATIKKGVKADYSNYGSKVDISGPTGWYGESYLVDKTIDAREMMITYYPTTKTSVFETPGIIPRGTTLSFGTSLSAPEVSAALATLISKDTNRDGSQNYYNRVKDELFNNSNRFLIDEKIGIGEVRIKD
jgi:Subtilisin-like serine proteases